MLIYNQSILIDKINLYLKSKKRPLIKQGYCHGLSLLWLYKMSTGSEQWFYNIIKKIVACKDKNIERIEMDIEKLLTHIEWLQNSDKYARDTHQMDIEKIIDDTKRIPISHVFTRRQFDTTIDAIAKPKTMICLSGPTHTIGLYCRKNKFFVYNANYDSGEALVLHCVRLVKYEIIKCLFTDLHLPIERLALEINLINNKYPINKNALVKKLILNSKQINDSDDAGYTPLYLACENNDETTVMQLLENKADPTQPAHEGETCLTLVSRLGYAKLAKLLLAYGADPNSDDFPLYEAARYGHDEVIKILLSYGASQMYQTYEDKTPLGIAIKNRNWRCVIYLLLNIKCIFNIPKHDLKALRRNKESLLLAGQRQMSEFTMGEDMHLIVRFKKIFHVFYDTSPDTFARNRNLFLPCRRKSIDSVSGLQSIPHLEL